MSTAEDPLYDPRLVATLKADEPKTLATTKSKANAHTKENQKTPKPESPKSTDVDAQPKATKGAKRKAQAPPAEDQDTATTADAEVDEEDDGGKVRRTQPRGVSTRGNVLAWRHAGKRAGGIVF